MALIPAGSFEMGDHFGEGSDDELPVHTVTLDGFYMDKTEVTVGRFKAFLADSGYSWGGSWDGVDQYSPSDDHPMIYVNYDDAVAYSEWAGKRLPTEAEWEYAARGGLEGKRYPWGDEIDSSKATYDSGNDGTTKLVGSFEANGYGLYDMAGNVWECCQDWYGADYYSSSPTITLRGREQAHLECFGVALTPVLPSTCGWLLAATTLRILGATSTGFDVYQDRISLLIYLLY